MLRIIKKTVKSLFTHQPVQVCNIVTLAPSELLKDRFILVTGGTSGIGYSIAQSCLMAGASVIITGRSADKLRSACETLSEKGAVRGYVLNNLDVKSFECAFKKMLDDQEGHAIDTLINNAGVNFKGMPNANEEEFDLVIGTNLKGVFFLSQMFGKYLVSNKIRGNILNISSASCVRPADSAYSLSKWGIRGLTLGLAKSLGAYGITVNGIAPGPTATPMMNKRNDSDLSLNRIPLGRYITPEEIANMAVFLISEMGRSVMGDIVFMTGGAGNLTYDDVPYSF